ncbi:hypothetical protein OBBRIDRAFT_497839 [Obba rivulosa]|uniref:Secreted protein n=1 Tax=Obba rivulosa TaxID=1052685 RepID=A0A8E2DTT9_9APHY|nr:hypothetical protein OBBRIDRAFT_497839 [Obba rivulosa]
MQQSTLPSVLMCFIAFRLWWNTMCVGEASFRVVRREILRMYVTIRNDTAAVCSGPMKQLEQFNDIRGHHASNSFNKSTRSTTQLQCRIFPESARDSCA